MDPGTKVWVKRPGPDESWVRAAVDHCREFGAEPSVSPSSSSKEKGDRGGGGRESTRDVTVHLILQDNFGNNILNSLFTIISVPIEGSTSEYETIKLRNVDDDDLNSHIDDLTSLTHLHEPSILNCLHSRFEEGIIYTFTGPILIALNPFQRLSLYSQDFVRMYQKAGESSREGRSGTSMQALKPHVYKIADNSFRNMVGALESALWSSKETLNISQSILVSGESGAGNIYIDNIT